MIETLTGTAEIVFIWWNTSLSPVSKRNRSSPDELNSAFLMVSNFINQYNADCICLAEISVEDAEFIFNSCQLEGYGLYNGNISTGRSSFDTFVIYNFNKMVISDAGAITYTKRKKTLKVAQNINFISTLDGEVFNLFISHWPSRLWCEKNSADRSLLGIRLRDEIDKLSDSGNVGNVIIMGDFNDEPFDVSLSEHLMATRDLHVAISDDTVLYNPFWRYMCNRSTYKKGYRDESQSGTYYYKGGDINKWCTFDQVIVSPVFLGRSSWHLVEDKVQVVNVPDYLALVLSKNTIFDHMPIMAVLERNN
ncbi:endonuclease/exonuclease/phosphatase family protein [Pantoea ananatis]|uniref:endonuclease/exonuclease/phosphatase family protein n=1 Tax=Pantoea ananas TaxID=553 RepID=UPI001B31461E|nr:endonuclease/exonuclease/phosphatase family protein [Pantoea ananatis]